jgi:uncharacterized protein YkwD
MQVARSLRRLVNGKIALFAILTAAQLVQPTRVVAQQADFVNEAQRLINDVRSKLPSCNLLQSGQAFVVPASATRPRPVLTWNPKLATIAQSHSQAMAKESFFDHVDTNGKNVADRAKGAGYRYRVVSENIAAGQDSLSEVVMEWVASKGHCENMIDERVTEFGLAMVQSPNPADPYATYWTLVLGNPSK